MILEEELDFQGIEEEDEEEFLADSERFNNSGGDKDKGKGCFPLTNRAVCIHVSCPPAFFLTCSVLFSSADTLQGFSIRLAHHQIHFVSCAAAGLVFMLGPMQSGHLV